MPDNRQILCKRPGTFHRGLVSNRKREGIVVRFLAGRKAIWQYELLQVALPLRSSVWRDMR